MMENVPSLVLVKDPDWNPLNQRDNARMLYAKDHSIVCQKCSRKLWCVYSPSVGFNLIHLLFTSIKSYWNVRAGKVVMRRSGCTNLWMSLSPAPCLCGVAIVTTPCHQYVFVSNGWMHASWDHLNITGIYILSLQKQTICPLNSCVWSSLF